MEKYSFLLEFTPAAATAFARRSSQKAGRAAATAVKQGMKKPVAQATKALPKVKPPVAKPPVKTPPKPVTPAKPTQQMSKTQIKSSNNTTRKMGTAGKILGGGVGGALGVAAGGAVGTVGGLATGLQKDQNGERHIIRNTLVGGLGGAAAGGAASGYLGARGGKFLGTKAGRVWTRPGKAMAR